MNGPLQCMSLVLIDTRINCTIHTYIVKSIKKGVWQCLNHILWPIFKSCQELWRMFSFSYNTGYKTLNLFTCKYIYIVQLDWTYDLIKYTLYDVRMSKKNANICNPIQPALHTLQFSTQSVCGHGDFWIYYIVILTR